MFRKSIAVASWACLLFIVYATLSSHSGRPGLTSAESELTIFIERFGAYALLGCLFCLTFPHRVVLVCVIVFGSAVLLEFLQIFVPDRDARVVDALVKLAGGFVGISFAKAVQAFSETGRFAVRSAESAIFRRE